MKHTVRRCNPAEGAPTKVLYMGVVPMSESKAISCGGLALDFLLKFGILIKTDNDALILTSNYEAKICYIIGDVKTVDNINKIIRDLFIQVGETYGYNPFSTYSGMVF